MENNVKHGVFWHKCEQDGCDKDIQYDDEPKCFEHSPDEGSSVRGYSAFEKWTQAMVNADSQQRSMRRTITLEVHFENVASSKMHSLEDYLKHLVRLGVEREGGVRIEVNSAV